MALIEELHNRIIKQSDEIERLKQEKVVLVDKISKNYLGELLRAVNVMRQGLQERKKKHEQIESGLSAIAAVVEKMKGEE
jgi:hypothetical protein